MSHFDNKSIPALGDGAATTVTTQTAADAMAYLARHDATDLAETLGLRQYQGHDWRSHSKRSVPVMREAIA